MRKVHYLLTNLGPILLVLMGWLSLDLIRERIPTQTVTSVQHDRPFLFMQEGRQHHARKGRPVYEMAFGTAEVDAENRLVAQRPVLISYGVEEGQQTALFRLEAANLSWDDETIMLEKDVVLHDLNSEGRIRAQRALVQTKGRRVEFSEGFVLTQDQMMLWGDLLTVELGKNESRIFTAHGAPLVYTQAGIHGRAASMRYVMPLPQPSVASGEDNQVGQGDESLEMHGRPLTLSSRAEDGTTIELRGQRLWMPDRKHMQVQGMPASFTHQNRERALNGQARSIHYAIADDQLELKGQVNLNTRAMNIAGEHLVYDMEAETVQIYGAPASFAHHKQGKPLRGRAAKIYSNLAKGHVQLEGGAFLTDDAVTVRGAELFYDTQSDNWRLAGSDAKTADEAQVEILIPKKRDR